MGCGSSKLDTLPAVALCRDRCELLDEALRLRFALAEAHLGYMKSLKDVGFTLRSFFEQDLGVFDESTHGLPLLDVEKKVAEIVEGTESSSELGHSHHHLVLDSDSGSHLDLSTDSDDGETCSRSVHENHVEAGTTKLPLNDNFAGQFGYAAEFQHEVPVGFSNGFMHTNHMKNQAVPSVLYEQKQFIPETGYVDQSSYYNHGVYEHWNAKSSSLGDGYLNYGGGYGSGLFGSSSRYGGNVVDAGSRDDYNYKPMPPPPSPPRESSWDFLNPFYSVYDLSYSAYPSSRDLKEVREEEGIPDLEEVGEDDLNEVVKEVHDMKSADIVSRVGNGMEKLKKVVDAEIKKVDEVENQSPRVGSAKDERIEYEVQMTKEKVVEHEERITVGVSEISPKHAKPRSVSDIVKDIHTQFDNAAETGNELAGLLEAGRLPYRKKHGAHLAPSKMLHAITPSLPIVFSHPSKSVSVQSSALAVMDVALTDIDEVTGMKTKSLSSTLQKLYLWEKKLYIEVKAEEKMRVLHDKKRRKLMQLDAKGADAHKVVATRALVRSLGTKIKVAIQVVDRISNTLNKIRDEELWPQISQLIHGLTRMWRSMLECHRSQLQAIQEARNLDAIVSHQKFSEANLKVKSDLEHELISWALRFSTWSSTQKDFAKALNSWLFKCILYEPEETPDGVAPFSPGQIGAPPIFTVCNEWVQSLNQISEKEVVDAIRELSMSVFSFWERDRLILRQNMVTNKELERQVRSLDREDHKIQKGMKALEKRIVSVSRASSGIPSSDKCVYKTNFSSGTLYDSLQCVFISMEQYAEESKKVYEELLRQSDEEPKTARNPETSLKFSNPS